MHTSGIVHADLTGRHGGDSRPLTAREEEALRYIAEGLTNAQAATRMGIQTTTVDTYVKRIRAKLGLGNKAELTRKAIEMARLDDDPAAPAPADAGGDVRRTGAPSHHREGRCRVTSTVDRPVIPVAVTVMALVAGVLGYPPAALASTTASAWTANG
jgi:DNA-binding CsgD family transcriptional regulator